MFNIKFNTFFDIIPISHNLEVHMVSKTVSFKYSIKSTKRNILPIFQFDISLFNGKQNMVQLFNKTPWFKDKKKKIDLTRGVEKYKYCIIIL